MPSDPKWRVIAKKSGQRIGDVIAVFTFIMVNASANASERGRTHNLFADDIAAALDLETDDVEAIISAMTGKVLGDDGKLLGWEKRQPKREDSSAERAKAWRAERKRTQENANERPDIDQSISDQRKKNNIPQAASEMFFDGAVIRLNEVDYRKWEKAFPKLDLRAVLQSRDDWLKTQADDAVRAKWFISTSNWLANQQKAAPSAKPWMDQPIC